MPESIQAGVRFGRLTVIKQFSEFKRFYTCRCSCGKQVNVLRDELRRGHVRSCGCLFKDVRKTAGLKHGRCRIGNKAPEYSAYYFAKRACQTPGSKFHPQYGARGIEFHFSSFPEFLAAVGDRPSPRHRLRRIDLDGHYEQANLKWVFFPGKRRRSKRQ